MTGDFDSEFLGDIFDDLNSPEIQLAFEVQDVLQELLIKADVNAKARDIIWEDGQILSLRDSIYGSSRNIRNTPSRFWSVNSSCGWSIFRRSPIRKPS